MNLELEKELMDRAEELLDALEAFGLKPGGDPQLINYSTASMFASVSVFSGPSRYALLQFHREDVYISQVCSECGIQPVGAVNVHRHGQVIEAIESVMKSVASGVCDNCARRKYQNQINRSADHMMQLVTGYQY